MVYAFVHVLYAQYVCMFCVSLCARSVPFSMYLGGRGGSSPLYISIAYYMQIGGGEGVQIACKSMYILNGRPLCGVVCMKVQECNVAIVINRLFMSDYTKERGSRIKS